KVLELIVLVFRAVQRLCRGGAGGRRPVDLEVGHLPRDPRRVERGDRHGREQDQQHARAQAARSEAWHPQEHITAMLKSLFSGASCWNRYFLRPTHRRSATRGGSSAPRTGASASATRSATVSRTGRSGSSCSSSRRV